MSTETEPVIVAAHLCETDGGDPISQSFIAVIDGKARNVVDGLFAIAAAIDRMSGPVSRADLRALLERAETDIRAGWPEAAIDAMGRALRLV